MPEIRALLVDDEPLARRALRALLGHHADIAIAGECRDGAEAVAAIRDLRPHLVFLDVQMPGLDGFAVLRALGGRCPPAVVLVTAYDEFAVRAFEAEALDFLVKPFSDRRFHQTVDRVRRRLAQAEVTELARRLSAAAQRLQVDGPPGEDPRWLTQLVVTSGVRSVPIPVASIAWIEADDYYVRVHVGRRSHLHRRSLTLLESELDPRRFVRIHRSALINLGFVREVLRNGGMRVVLEDGTRLEVSERRRAAASLALSRFGAPRGDLR